MLNQLVCSIAQVFDETGISLFVLIFAKKRQEVAVVAGFWRVYPAQSQHNARNVGSDRTLSERCLTNVDSDPRSLPAPGLWRPSSASPPPRGGHPASLPVGTPGNGWDSSRLELSTGRTVPCARALLHKARAAEGRRAAASWMELAQYRTGPRCPSLVSQAGIGRWAEGAQTDAASGTQRLNNRLLRQQAVPWLQG